MGIGFFFFLLFFLVLFWVSFGGKGGKVEKGGEAMEEGADGGFRFRGKENSDWMGRLELPRWPVVLFVTLIWFRYHGT